MTGPRAFWRGARGVRKAQLVSRHLSADFVQKNYEVVKQLNSGSFSRVNLVRERGTDALRVCKVIDIKDMDPHVLGMMRKEVQVLSALDHPNIVRLYEFAEDEKTQELVLILEYVPGGDCIDLLEERERLLPEKLVARIIHQLLVVLNYCHKSGITHRDVKPENIMLTSLSDDAFCKVIDFGLATPYKGRVKEFAGTVSYLAPELAIAQSGFSMAADIWAVGVTAFELLAGISPFGKQQEYGNSIEPILEQLCEYESFDEDLYQTFRASPGHQRLWRSSEARDFLRVLLAADPEERPTAEKALQHPWLLRHQPDPVPIAEEMLRSFVGFTEATQMHRSCLYALAGKGHFDELDVHMIGYAFAQADSDHDGRISKEDLLNASQASSWWSWNRGSEVDMEAFLKAADQDCKGYLGYTDFVAACLFQIHPTLDDALVDNTFDVLDHDRNGRLKADDVMPAFPRYPAGLPKYCAFKRAEWHQCVFREVEDELARTSTEDSEESPGFLARIFSGFFCRHIDDGEGHELSVDATPPQFRDKVSELRSSTACALPPIAPAADMVLAARATAQQAKANYLKPPKGLLPWAATGASFSSASTFTSFSSAAATGNFGPRVGFS
ncbi:unnamed protein product [Durusdinium trenchii]|uniref:Non-specific serine/threonine protein kinase n=1 Tax=Durusdinium trenchii TaxID=1381693 RepID=A0ABP0N5M1_9DINO